jgi:hypothetical protein
MRKSKVSEALRVAQDVAAIRAALHQRGYRLRKRPKQAVWTVYLTDDSFYDLIYQPAPSSSWVLHPQNNNSARHSIETIIQRALIKPSAGIAGRVS